MRKIRGRKHMRILALMLAAIVAVTTASVSAEARPVKPKLNKPRLKIVKGKTAKLKVKNVKTKKIRKTVWTVNKSGKKVVAFTKKSNTSITLKGKKKGTAKITAKIKVGRKVYKRTAKVTVKLSASDKEDSGDDEDEVEIEEDTGENDESSVTKTPTQTSNIPEPAETEPAAPVATEDTPDLSDTSKPVIPLRGLTFVNVPSKLGCGDPEAEMEGRSATVQVAYEPSNTTQRELVWKSSDETLATVDANGLVTANSMGRTGMVSITAICRENATVSASVIIEIYSLQPVSEDYSVLDSPDTKLLPKGKITGADQTPVSDVDTFKLQNGQLKGTFNDRNENIVLDLGRQIDVSKYGGVEIEGIVPGQLSLEFYDSSFDMYRTKDNGYETDWWEMTIGRTYPFFIGSCPWRYEGGGMNYLKQAANGYRGPDYPDDPKSVLPAEESLCYSLEKLTDSDSSGAWDKVRYIIIKSNLNPLLSSQYTFDKRTEVEYTITGLKFLAEEVVSDLDEGHYIVYNSEAADAALNVASSENNVTSYYADKISKDKPADKRDTTINLSRMKYIKVKVKDTDTVKLSLVKDGDTIEDAVVVGEEDGSGNRSVYFSLDDVDEEDLENVDQICVETAAGGKVTWVSATGGEISYKLDGSEKKIEVKDGKSTEVMLDEYGTEDPDWTPGAIVTEKPGVAPTNVPIFPGIADSRSLKNNADFNMGTLVSYDKIKDEKFTELVRRHFDVVTFETEMKGYSLLDTEASKVGDGTPVCDFEQADEMVEWAISNGLHVRGSVLIWEYSMASSFFYKGYDNTGMDKDLVDKDTLLMRMESYENQVISHFETKYPGAVIAWDVVNEAIDNSSEEIDPATGLHLYTDGNFYKILGGEYIKYAFQYANDAVKAAAKDTGNEILLYYNDFNCYQSPKTEYILDLIDYLNADPDNKLLPCIGMEGYVLMTWPNASDIGTAMEKFADKGVQVGITEMTVRNYDDDQERHAERYSDVFTQYCEFDKSYPGQLTNVSIWGLLDRPDLLGDTENYDYQIYGTYSGLFTADYEEKEAFRKVLALLQSNYRPGTEEPTEPTKMPNPPQPSNTSSTAAPYVLTISEEMEADGTKNKVDYRQDVDWSEPGQVTFTNVNAYNGGLMLKLQENGEPMDMSGYKYIEADVETWADGGDEVFLKSFTDSSSIWDTIDNGKFEGEPKEGRRTVRFDIKDYRKALKSIGAIMISPVGDGTSDVHTSLTLYNVRFVS